MDSWSRFDIGDGSSSSIANFSGGFVWLRFDRLRGLTFEQLCDRGARRVADWNRTFINNSYIWDGHGAWACDRRMDWRSLWNAHEFFGRRRDVCCLERFYLIYRSSAHRSSRSRSSTAEPVA